MRALSSAGSFVSPASSAYSRSTRSSGRGRLPVCVVLMWSVFICMQALLLATVARHLTTLALWRSPSASDRKRREGPATAPPSWWHRLAAPAWAQRGWVGLQRAVQRRIELRVLHERLPKLARRLDPVRALRQEDAAGAYPVHLRIVH